MKISFRSLYLKIFIWFWLAMIIINVAFFAAVALTRPTPTRRLKETSQFAPPVDDARLHRVIDALDEVAAETGKSIPQIALNWLLQRPTVSTILIGARNEEQLRDNLGAVGWSLSAAQVAHLDAASALVPPYPYYPYWNGQFAERTPPAVTAVNSR